MQSTYNEIQKDVLEIIKDRFDITINPDDLKKHLFSKDIDLDDISLTYLVSILEEKYKIRFSEDDFMSSDFLNVEGLSRHLCDRVIEK